MNPKDRRVHLTKRDEEFRHSTSECTTFLSLFWWIFKMNVGKNKSISTFFFCPPLSTRSSYLVAAALCSMSDTLANILKRNQHHCSHLIDVITISTPTGIIIDLSNELRHIIIMRHRNHSTSLRNIISGFHQRGPNDSRANMHGILENCRQCSRAFRWFGRRHLSHKLSLFSCDALKSCIHALDNRQARKLESRGENVENKYYIFLSPYHIGVSSHIAHARCTARSCIKFGLSVSLPIAFFLIFLCFIGLILISYLHSHVGSSCRFISLLLTGLWWDYRAAFSRTREGKASAVDNRKNIRTLDQKKL